MCCWPPKAFFATGWGPGGGDLSSDARSDDDNNDDDDDDADADNAADNSVCFADVNDHPSEVLIGRKNVIQPVRPPSGNRSNFGCNTSWLPRVCMAEKSANFFRACLPHSQREIHPIWVPHLSSQLMASCFMIPMRSPYTLNPKSHRKPEIRSQKAC